MCYASGLEVHQGAGGERHVLVAYGSGDNDAKLWLARWDNPIALTLTLTLAQPLGTAPEVPPEWCPGLGSSPNNSGAVPSPWAPLRRYP